MFALPSKADIAARRRAGKKQRAGAMAGPAQVLEGAAAKTN
jgi:hypothetical protein